MLASYVSPAKARGSMGGALDVFTPMTLSLYAYGSLRPSRFFDPTGLEPEEAGLAAPSQLNFDPLDGRKHVTLEEAVAAFKRAGLEVSFGGDRFVAAAGIREAPAELKAQGVSSVADFGFSARKIGDIWFFRPKPPPAPSVECSTLDDVVARGLALFSEYQATANR